MASKSEPLVGKKRPFEVVDIFGVDGSIVINLGNDTLEGLDMPVIKIVNDDEPQIRDDFTESSVGESVAAQNLQTHYMDAKERRRIRDRDRRAKLIEDQTDEGKALLDAILQRRREKDRARRLMRRGDTSDEGQQYLEAQKIRRKQSDRLRKLRKQGYSQSESSDGGTEEQGQEHEGGKKHGYEYYQTKEKEKEHGQVYDNNSLERSSSGYIQDDSTIEINIS